MDSDFFFPKIGRESNFMSLMKYVSLFIYTVSKHVQGGVDCRPCSQLTFLYHLHLGLTSFFFWL